MTIYGIDTSIWGKNNNTICGKILETNHVTVYFLVKEKLNYCCEHDQLQFQNCTIFQAKNYRNYIFYLQNIVLYKCK